MRKKDFELIAKAVADMKSLGADQEYVADLLATRLARAYPLFNKDKFLKACGIE
jgi:hypothetical protein